MGEPKFADLVLSDRQLGSRALGEWLSNIGKSPSRDVVFSTHHCTQPH
jgi:hypothetical protein